MNSLLKLVLLSLFSFSMAANKTQQYLHLNDGKSIPIVGYGSYKVDDEAGYQAIKYTIEHGYRHIDTALSYGNEKTIGRAVRDLIGNKTVKREDLFIVTKVANNYHTRENALKSVNISLNNLGLDYVDLVLIHWPFGVAENDPDPLNITDKTIFSDVDYLETWKGLEDAHAKGLAKSIGLSNFNHLQLERVIKNAKVKPVMNQVECHPHLNQQKLIEFCHNNSVAVTAYSPLGRGSLITDATIKSIADKHNKTTAQVLIRYQIERNVVVIPKSSSPKRIDENFNVFDFKLTTDEIKKIDSLNKNERVVDPKAAKNHKYYPFNEPY